MDNKIVKDSLIGGLTTASSFVFSSHPEIAVPVSVGVPFFVEITTDFISQALNLGQSNRLKNALHHIMNKFELRSSRGEQIRKDEFITAKEGEEAKQALEGILSSIKDEFEKKKISYHSNFFVDLCFNEKIKFDQAITILKILKDLSYRQLVIIAYTKKEQQLKTSGWEARFKDFHQLVGFGDFYSEILSLYHSGILVQDCMGQALGGAPFRLSQFGNILYDEASLNEIPEKELSEIKNSITIINNVISGKNMTI